MEVWSKVSPKCDQIPDHFLDQSRPLSGPDSGSLFGPDSRSLFGPESRSLFGSNSRTLFGPKPRTLFGPNSRTHFGPESRTHSPPQGGFPPLGGRISSVPKFGFWLGGILWLATMGATRHDARTDPPTKTRHISMSRTTQRTRPEATESHERALHFWTPGERRCRAAPTKVFSES